jgi:hypothetical protein
MDQGMKDAEGYLPPMVTDLGRLEDITAGGVPGPGDEANGTKT